MDRTTIGEKTGFDSGAKFESAAEVRDYFTTENLRSMFPGDSLPTQAELDAMADAVIRNGWHMIAGAK